jgi:tripartite-type tricarboxylate transporter receptor subunit TctC
MLEAIMQRRDMLTFGSAALAARTLAPLRAFAQSKYPERPIRLVIPFTPGGVNDTIGRPWANKMKSLLGTVVVENIGGAGSSLGAAAVARAAPDGYTLLQGGAGSHVINPIATEHPLYDPIKAFEAISILGVTGLAIVVHPALPARTLKELIDYAKANPGKLSYGSAGVGSMTHLTGELLKSLMHAPDMVHVPYKGGGQLITDLISGQIQLIAQSVTGQVIELNRTGRLRMLAVTSPARLIAAPDVPTALEAGLPGMVSQNFIGLFAPARTPPMIVQRIAEATHVAMADREFQEAFVASGFEPYVDSSPQMAKRFVEDEIARWTPIIKAIGLKLE